MEETVENKELRIQEIGQISVGLLMLSKMMTRVDLNRVSLVPVQSILCSFSPLS